MMKVRGCRICTLGDCMCHLVIRWNNIRNIHTPPDLQEGYRRKYLINTYGIDLNDHTNADRYCEILQNWVLPAFLKMVKHLILNAGIMEMADITGLSVISKHLNPNLYHGDICSHTGLLTEHGAMEMVWV